MSEHQHSWYVVCRGCDAQPEVNQHFVTFDKNREWFVEHSLQCRMDGEMMRGCVYQRAVERCLDQPAFKPAPRSVRWRIDLDNPEHPATFTKAEIQP